MNAFIEPLLWAGGCALVVVALLAAPDLLDLLPDARPGKWVSAR